MRNPATGREFVMEADPGEIYLDRDTGDRLEVVGRGCPGRWRTCGSALGATSTRSRI